MSKKPSSEPEIVKLQIPVSRELADQLAVHAMELDYTQARLCKVLLGWAVKDTSRIAKWLTIRLIQKRPKGAKLGWLQLSDQSAVRLQVPIQAKVAHEIEAIASNLNHTTVRMAALLLDFTMADDDLLLRLLASPSGKVITKKLGRPTEKYESAEIDVED
jgi:hypothetical protein